VFQAWIVANKPKLTKSYDDKMFFDIDEAKNKCEDLNKQHGKDVWKVYEISVDIMGQ